MRLLDTNHCSLVLDNDRRATSQLTRLAGDGFCTSVIVEGELHHMAYASKDRVLNLTHVTQLLADMRVFEIGAATAATYGQLKADLIKHFGPRERAARRRFTLASLGFTDNDLWIAATALQHDLTIVSADSDFSRIAEVRPLQVESWLQPVS